MNQATETQPRLARQIVHHSADYPSALVVDVVPETLLEGTVLD